MSRAKNWFMYRISPPQMWEFMLYFFCGESVCRIGVLHQVLV